MTQMFCRKKSVAVKRLAFFVYHFIILKTLIPITDRPEINREFSFKKLMRSEK